MTSLGQSLSAGVLVLFVFSGAIKWIPGWPADPTLIFGLLTVLISLRTVLAGVSFADGTLFILVTSLCFLSWYLASAFWSASPAFVNVKSGALVLNMIALLSPVLVLRTPGHFEWVDRWIWTLAGIAIVVVFGFYLSGQLAYLIYQGYDREVLKIPDYLVIGSIVGIGVLSALRKATRGRLLFGLLGIGVMLILTARGPFLFLMLLIVGARFFYRRPLGMTQVVAWRPWMTWAVVVSLVAALMFWDGAEAMVVRFTKLLDDSRALEGGLRFNEFGIAASVAREAPFHGVGLGGFGLGGYGTDTNVYPHNLYLEALAEAGIIGLLLFAFSQIVVLVESWRQARDGHGASYLVILVFLMLNYLKSGGFIGARDLYLFIGIIAAWVNLPAAGGHRLERPA